MHLYCMYAVSYVLCYTVRLAEALLEKPFMEAQQTLTYAKESVSKPLSISTFPLPRVTISFQFNADLNYSCQSPSIQELSSP